MLSANMDQGAIDFQLEAAISKVYASVSNKKNLIIWWFTQRPTEQGNQELVWRLQYPIVTSNNQRLEKCVRCVLLLYNWDLHVSLGDDVLQTWL